MRENSRSSSDHVADIFTIADSDPMTVLRGLLGKLQEQSTSGNIRPLNPDAVQRHMTAVQGTRYLQAIREARLSGGGCAISPSLLFDAAEKVLKSDLSIVQARVGILPGTMNPPHYGHISVAVAAIISFQLSAVLLAPGNIVPDKPDSPGFNLRAQMVDLAANDEYVRGWLHTTSVRRDAIEMFFREPHNRELGLGDSGPHRRSIMDIAAFIWLFRSNPNVNWFYLIGSDKVAGYGRNGECALVIDTLGDPRANTEIVYYPRLSHKIDVVRDIQPYPWLFKKWQEGYFKEPPIMSCNVSGSAIRAAIGRGGDDPGHTDLRQYLPKEVLNFVTNNKTLHLLYAREADEANSPR